jgi:hypothetical protein
LDSNQEVPGSFRDPSGFLFWQNGSLYRQINISYKERYVRLMDSGLFEELAKTGLLIRHQEVDIQPVKPQIAYKIIQPEQIDFISYPYEWCFSQLKDAALTTLEIQKKALNFGMSLKDASAYNIQFRKGKPAFIDTLSFEIYREGQPWIAYRQFCQHFLAPLALMSYKDIRLNQLLRVYIDGIPLDLASSLQPFRSRLQLSLLTHIHLHARSQNRFAKRKVNSRRLSLSRLGLQGLIDNLESTIKKLHWQPLGTEWANYYEETSYSQNALEDKKQIVAGYLDRLHPQRVWDLGSNTGVFSRLASRLGIVTVSLDSDPAAVEQNYLSCRKNQETNILPLVVDLTNPSPAIGWQNQERLSLAERGPADTVLALALVHHLAISNNVPLKRIAAFFSSIGNSLVIEFVPKTDPQVQRLLATREDVFTDYSQPAFENEFSRFFNIQNSVKIKDSERTLYLMRKISR